MTDEKRTKEAMELYRALAGLINEGNGTTGVCVSSMGSMDVIYAIIDLIDARIALKKRGEVNMENMMNFGSAIEALKDGRKVARKGWNGKGMWLVLVPGTPEAPLFEGSPYSKALQLPSCEILPHIDMWTVNANGRRAMLPGWLASQTDMLSEDWVIVE